MHAHVCMHMHMYVCACVCPCHPPRTPQALLEDMKMLEDEFGLAEMATPERDDDPNSLNGDFHDPRV